MSAESAQREGPGVWVGGEEATAGTRSLCLEHMTCRDHSSQCVVVAGAIKFGRTFE